MRTQIHTHFLKPFYMHTCKHVLKHSHTHTQTHAHAGGPVPEPLLAKISELLAANKKRSTPSGGSQAEWGPTRAPGQALAPGCAARARTQAPSQPPLRHAWPPVAVLVRLLTW